MKKVTAFLFSILILCFSFAFFSFFSFAQLNAPVDTVVVVGSTFSQLTLDPLIVEIGEESTVLILVRDSSYNPLPDRVVEIYEGNASGNLLVTQPLLPSDENGNTEGYVKSMVEGIYTVCIKDVTDGTGILISSCHNLTVLSLPVPVVGLEPEYTSGDWNTISWTMDNASSYQYYAEVSKTADFSDIVLNSGWIDETQYTASGLDDGEIYYYRVKARNAGGGESDWSNIVSSTQDISGPSIIFKGSSPLPEGTIITDFDPDIEVSLSYTLFDVSGIADRDFTIILLDGSRVPIPYTAVFDGVNWVAKIRLGDLPKEGGLNLYPAYSFYLEVSDNFGNVAGNGAGYILVPVELPPVIPPVIPPVDPPVEPPVVPPVTPPVVEDPTYTIPGAPVQVTPFDNPNPKFTWVPAYDSKSNVVSPGYALQWCENRNFIECEKNSIRSNTNEVILKESLASGTWYARVRVYDSTNGKYGDWSDISRFVITYVEPEPPIVQPPVVVPPKESSILQNFLGNIGNVFNDLDSTVTQILDNSFGKLPPELKTTTTVGILVANMVAGMNVLLNLLGSVPYFIAQISIALLSLLGFRKKGVFSGYVYDSITKEPVGQAIVRVFNSMSELVWTDVTDSNGRYKTPELVDGEYQINVTARNYIYPSEVIKGLTDVPLENIYHGAVFRTKNGKAPDFSIPLDSTNATKAQIANERVMSRSRWFVRILHVVLFIVGLTFSLYTLRTNPVWWNYLILFLYLPSLVFLILSRKEKYGVVRDTSGKVMSGISVHLFDSEFKKVLSTRVTDASGRYRFLVESGIYTISVEMSDYVLVNDERYNSLSVSGKGSKILCPNLVVKKREE